MFFKLELVELDRKNQMMVVKCWVDSVGWGVDSMGGLIGEWLGEVSKVSDWSINIVGNFVSGKFLKASEFGLLINAGGLKGVVMNSNMCGKEVEEGDTIAGVVTYVYHLAKVVEVSCDALLATMATTRKTGQMARVGAVVKGKVVMHNTEHSMVISNPANLYVMLAMLPLSLFSIICAHLLY